jgi:hypothetical protein
MGSPKATMDLLACGKDGLINMIEVGAQEISEEHSRKVSQKQAKK